MLNPGHIRGARKSSCYPFTSQTIGEIRRVNVALLGPIWMRWTCSNDGIF